MNKTQHSPSIASEASERSDLSFVVEGHPVAYVRMIRGVRQKRGERYLAYRDAVGYRAKEAGAVLLGGPVSVRVIAYVDHRRWDVDNLGKAILDALSGICFEDDRQVEDIHVTVLVAGSHEHVRIFVRPAEGASA